MMMMMMMTMIMIMIMIILMIIIIIIIILKMKQQTHDKLNVWRTHYLAVWPRDVVPVETHKLTLALHRVSSSSVFRASD